MREKVIAVSPAIFSALVVQNINIVIQANAGRFVVIDQTPFAAHALNEPNRGRIRNPEIPSRMDAHTLINLNRTNAALVEHDPHFVGVERTLDRRFERILAGVSRGAERS